MDHGELSDLDWNPRIYFTNKLSSLHCEYCFFWVTGSSMMYIFDSMIFCDQIPWNSVSGDCWWYPCQGSHLIGECATHCCVGISSSKCVGRSYWQDYVFVGAWNEKGRSILPKTIWFWVETEYLAHSLPILPSSAGAWPSLCGHCSSGPRKWWPRSGAVAKFGGTYMFSIHYGCIFV